MNYKLILKVVGRVFLIEALMFVLPLLVGVIYNEGLTTINSFLIPISVLIVLGMPLSLLKTKEKSIYVKEGFVIVAICWIVFSLVGAVPFVISESIPNYVDALFETVSGFTTTGATILSGAQIEGMAHSFMFWRCFTHWIGGMGVLVFVIAILPGYNEGMMHIFRAESPGPSVGKLVSKIKFTARILYGIYIALTLLEFIMLLFGGMSVFESILHSFSTAGTGGFSVKSNSIAGYNSVYIEMVIAVFMLLFSLNFNFYFFLIVRNFSKAFKSEEFLFYIFIIVASTLIIALNILSSVDGFGQALRYSFFQVTAISSTTGFTSFNFDNWPALSQSILLLLSCMGACAGSTGGGIKVSRIAILIKSSVRDFKKVSRPRYVNSVKYEGQSVDREVIRNIKTYFVMWCIIIVFSTILLSIFGQDLYTNFTSTITCIGNVGPAVGGSIGSSGCFAGYNVFSKIWLSFIMLVGRLEIFPMLILFTPSVWKKN